MRRGLQQGKSCVDGQQSTCLDESRSNGGSTSGSHAWQSTVSGQGLLHREGNGSSSTGSSAGSKAGSDGLHPEHGGSSGNGSDQRSYRVIDDGGNGSGRTDDAGVNEAPWFDPITEDCPGGVCTVPWLVADSVDNVNSPAHYTDGGIECIEAIEAQMSQEEFQGYLRGNCAKYLWRYKNKSNPVEDLKKCRWYLERLIDSHS